MDNYFLIFLFLVCVGCEVVIQHNAPLPVHASAFIYDDKAAAVDSSGYIYDPNAPALRSNKYTYQSAP